MSDRIAARARRGACRSDRACRSDPACLPPSPGGQPGPSRTSHWSGGHCRILGYTVSYAPPASALTSAHTLTHPGARAANARMSAKIGRSVAAAALEWPSVSQNRLCFVTPPFFFLLALALSLWFSRSFRSLVHVDLVALAVARCVQFKGSLARREREDEVRGLSRLAQVTSEWEGRVIAPHCLHCNVTRISRQRRGGR